MLKRDSYATLFLRALRSLGESAVHTIAYSVAVDVCVPAERGSMLGPMMAAANLGPWIGPVLGDWIAQASGGFPLGVLVLSSL